MTVHLFTSGFAGQPAAHFFTGLRAYGVRHVIDTRARPDSHLAGFARQTHLVYFLDALGGITYAHHADLAPADALLNAYQDKRITWDAYAAAYRDGLVHNAVAARYTPAAFDHACLLCACAKPDRCHRRILAEHLKEAWPAADLRIVHV